MVPPAAVAGPSAALAGLVPVAALSTVVSPLSPVPLHGGATGGKPHVLAVVVAVAGLWLLVAGLVAAVDRLLVALDAE